LHDSIAIHKSYVNYPETKVIYLLSVINYLLWF